MGEWEGEGEWVLRMSIVMGLMAGGGVREMLVEVVGGGDLVARRRKMGLGRMAWGGMRLRVLMTRSMGEGVGTGAGVGVRRGEGGMVVDGGERDAVL